MAHFKSGAYHPAKFIGRRDRIVGAIVIIDRFTDQTEQPCPRSNERTKIARGKIKITGSQVRAAGGNFSVGRISVSVILGEIPYHDSHLDPESYPELVCQRIFRLNGN